MKKLLLVISALFLVLSTNASSGDNSSKDNYLPYYNGPEFTPNWLKPNSKKLTDFHKISDFKFMNQLGEFVTQEDMKGKIYVASFFFTSCPGICPKMRSQLAKVQTEFRDNNDVYIISHSIQPENDTVEVLQDYADENDIQAGKWHLVTGKREDIYTIAREDYFANEDLGEYVSNNDFLHTENIVLVDHNRHIRGIYNGLNKTSINHLITDINTLQKESSQSK
ncbi:SCO family protein [uncultured Psychrosphaera sp.]|uniref:SCO family protein n=1 Tax=uncultured Psychrosphaera sp. TaxID=1403522 RepID=UPI0030F559D3